MYVKPLIREELTYLKQGYRLMGAYPALLNDQHLYYCLWYEVETLQVVRLARNNL